jgi:hypothetical protein
MLGAFRVLDQGKVIQSRFFLSLIYLTICCQLLKTIDIISETLEIQNILMQVLSLNLHIIWLIVGQNL